MVQYGGVFMTGASVMGEGKGYIRAVDEKGSINVSEDVVAVIVGTAAAEVEGVHGLYFSPGKELSQKISKKGLARSVKIAIDGDDIAIDVYVLIAKNHSVIEVGEEVQKAVMSAVEDMVGVIVRAVNVHVCGIALKGKAQQTLDS